MLDSHVNSVRHHDAFAEAQFYLGVAAAASDVERYAQAICRLLNALLATECVCVLRYRRHYFMASDRNSSDVADEFLAQACEKAGHADKLAERILELGGTPELDPETLGTYPQASQAAELDLDAMRATDLAAARAAADSYRQVIKLLHGYDPKTTRLLRGILGDLVSADAQAAMP